MPTIGKPMVSCKGDITTLLERGESTNGAHVRTRVVFKPGGLVAVPHRHLRQEETFEVVSGTLTYILNGEKHIAAGGTTVRIPQGAPHKHYCDGPEDLVVIQTLTPALDFDFLVENIIGLSTAGPKDPESALQGLVWIRKMQSTLALAAVPVWLQKLAAFFVTPFAYRLGYRAVYRHISGVEW